MSILSVGFEIADEGFGSFPLIFTKKPNAYTLLEPATI